MPVFLPAADRPPRPSRTIRFEGRPFGAEMSFFAVDSDPGHTVRLHTHPYTEIWIVQSGAVRFLTLDGHRDAGPNDIMIVEPETPHGFVNIGDGPLRMMCLHDSGEMVQTDLDPPQP